MIVNGVLMLLGVGVRKGGGGGYRRCFVARGCWHRWRPLLVDGVADLGCRRGASMNDQRCDLASAPSCSAQVRQGRLPKESLRLNRANNILREVV